MGEKNIHTFHLVLDNLNFGMVGLHTLSSQRECYEMDNLKINEMNTDIAALEASAFQLYQIVPHIISCWELGILHLVLFQKTNTFQFNSDAITPNFYHNTWATYQALWNKNTDLTWAMCSCWIFVFVVCLLFFPQTSLYTWVDKVTAFLYGVTLDLAYLYSQKVSSFMPWDSKSGWRSSFSFTTERGINIVLLISLTQLLR